MNLLKRWYKKFLKDMEKANKESFGDKKLDCCGLNSKPNNSKPNKTQK